MKFSNPKLTAKYQTVKEGGQLLSSLLNELTANIKIGSSGMHLERLAVALCKKHQVKPAFYRFNNYPYYTCVSVNDTVVHGLPNEQLFTQRDLVSLDFGIIFQGYYLDAARSKYLGTDKAVHNLVEATHQSFIIAAQHLVAGDSTYKIGELIEEYLKPQKMGIVEDLTGHGIGSQLQMPPSIYNFKTSKNNYQLKEGDMIAIEPMVNLGTKAVYLAQDGWSIKTRDGSYSAHWENTLIIGNDQTEVLTQ